ncbi:MAG TPA: Sec-independent protein translocase protein TatB [Pseudonocardiaceae bacterium]|jgi:sec-independent protein translocase protein TatB
MLDISAPEFLILVVAALFILGPERLPGAARWLGQTVRKVREYATGARDQLAAEVGDDFDELRKPLQNLARLRNVDPRRALTEHLLDATGGYDPRQDLRDLVEPQQQVATLPPVAAGERPPFDPDAT